MREGITVSSVSRRRLPAAAVLAGALALTLSACGTSGAGAAAVVGSERITTTDVQTAVQEINDAIGPDQSVPESSVLSWLMLAPYTIEAAGDAGTVASDTDACQLLVASAQGAQQQQGQEPEAGAGEVSCAADPYSEPTLLALRSYLSTGRTADSLSDAAAVETWWAGILGEAENAGIEVSPRFGTYRATTVETSGSLDELMSIVGTATPDWLATPDPTEDPAAEPTAPAAP